MNLREMYETVFPAIRLIVWKFQLTHGHEPSPDEFEAFVKTDDALLKNMWEQLKHGQSQSD